MFEHWLTCSCTHLMLVTRTVSWWMQWSCYIQKRVSTRPPRALTLTIYLEQLLQCSLVLDKRGSCLWLNISDIYLHFDQLWFSVLTAIHCTKNLLREGLKTNFTILLGKGKLAFSKGVVSGRWIMFQGMAPYLHVYRWQSLNLVG